MINDKMITVTETGNSSILIHLFFCTGYRTMSVAIISAVVYEIGIVMLDLLLLSSFVNYIPEKHKHIPPAWAEDGQSFRSLQVRETFVLGFSCSLINIKHVKLLNLLNWTLISSRKCDEIKQPNYNVSLIIGSWYFEFASE